MRAAVVIALTVAIATVASSAVQAQALLSDDGFHRRVLSRADWPAVRNGAVVVAIAAVRETVREMEVSERRRIVIRHPSGIAGTAWAAELREWLVALGVASSRIILKPGNGDDSLVLAVVGPYP